MQENISPAIYRHFRGGYYIVQACNAINESDLEQSVIYQSLQDGTVWIRPLRVFLEPVPEDKENPTGQKLRFERVTDFNNQLNMISTEALIKELLSRPDCPTEVQTSLNSDNMWREEYLVGWYISEFIDEHLTTEDFQIQVVFDSLDKAVSYVRSYPGYKILKRVFIKQDFD